MTYFLYYIVLVNVITFLVYAFDKFLSQHQKRRVPESWLHFLTLIGGGAGALAGQQICRHKTSKPSFFWIYWAIVTMQMVIVVYVSMNRR